MNELVNRPLPRKLAPAPRLRSFLLPWRREPRPSLAPLASVALLLLAWELTAFLRLRGLAPESLAFKQRQSTLPYAHDVLSAFVENAGSFLSAGLVTFGNALAGFLAGAAVGYGLALLMARARWVERSFYLYIVGSQMVPVIALAPILYGIIRNETLLKIVIAAYLTFFPVTVNVLKGLRSVNQQALDLLHSYAASSWQIEYKLRMRASLPYLFNALKIASTGSLVGAIVAELMGGNRGLGVLMLQLQYSSYARSDKLWALVLEVALIGIIFFRVVSLAERRLVPWQAEYRRLQRQGGRP